MLDSNRIKSRKIKKQRPKTNKIIHLSAVQACKKTTALPVVRGMKKSIKTMIKNKNRIKAENHDILYLLRFYRNIEMHKVFSFVVVNRAGNFNIQSSTH